jgi:plasmid stabilization system protein ParE
MARRVAWTEAASSDLAEAAGYIARDSRYYAAAFVREVRAAARSLRVSSERGRIVPELGQPDIRELLVRSYRLVYNVAPRHVHVLALIHGARYFTKVWGEHDL